jgi:hypothetical protein
MTEAISADIQAILDNYEPPEAKLIVPADLDLKTKYKSEAEPYSYAQPSTRAVKTTHIDIAPLISNAGVRGFVANVAHGTFRSSPASLIVFSFSFRSGDHGFRFKNANVKITFAKHFTDSSIHINPTILKFAPRKIFGLPTVEGKRKLIGGEISLEVPAGPLTVGPSINIERESEYEKEHRFKTIGNYWSSKHGTDWDIVYWDIKENKRTQHGIPDRLNVAVIVEREGPFTAHVEVTVDTPIANGIFAFPWSKNKPVAFAPGVVIGEQPKTTKFDELTDADWRSMIPYEDEWENKFTEETLRIGMETPVAGSVGPVAAAALAKTKNQGERLSMVQYNVDIDPADAGEVEESDDR